ncbi:DUF2484 family protein [Frigidibacter sp. RF13]|uniref:DUF2484 family protein n=1 Tax=Frigidibacter sp. RF13 TaxID=2997340 RepID=UPI00227176F6|nr:DUF2484 family protein [Frigidibacter sp. RF13]MCY1127403.1 DUF2484 family protein [Frigidibacter sp. RF13]
MNWSLGAALLWIVTACFIGALPSRDYHWRAAYKLIAVGIPILGWVTWSNGPILGLILLAAAASILRWPLIYLWRWVRRKVAG